ncbi:MAG: uncharacterized protein A8A55_3494 [Amphiamblys sp. WSBS2006]|nr:MAG: uncharacterized protein A8A55_3494 [Amphiamblys sp. WSBS2006]
METEDVYYTEEVFQETRIYPSFGLQPSFAYPLPETSSKHPHASSFATTDSFKDVVYLHHHEHTRSVYPDDFLPADLCQIHSFDGLMRYSFFDGSQSLLLLDAPTWDTDPFPFLLRPTLTA